MSDVGDAVTLTFTTTTGADVTAEVTNPAGATTTPATVTEDADTGNFPFTLTLSVAGMWRVVFRSTSPTAVQERWVRADPISTLPPLAVPEDVAAVWRTLTAAEDTLATALIWHASRIVRLRWPDLDDRIGANTLDRALVAQVVAGMVKRAMDRPTGSGVRQTSQTVGPYSTSTTYDAATLARFLYLDADDVALLAPVVTPSTSTVGSRSIRLVQSLAPPPC